MLAALLLTATCHSIKPFKSMESCKKEEKKAAQQQQWCNKRVPIAYIQFNLPVLLLAWLLLLTVAIYTASLSCYCVLTPKILIAQYLFSSSYYINSFFFFFHFLSLFHAILTSPPHSSCKSFFKKWGMGRNIFFFLTMTRASKRVLSFKWNDIERENARAIFLLF